MIRKSLALLVMIALSLCGGLAAKAGPTPTSATSTIALDPNWGFYDTRVWVHGTGFAADAEVTIEWKDLPHWQVFTLTNIYGDFDVLFDVPDGAIAGNHLVTATDEYGNTASSVFTLYYAYVEGGCVKIKTPKQYAQWLYDKDEFYHDSWKFYHDSYDGWYQLMYQDKGIYILRITYEGVTYVFDSARGASNAWPKPLVEEVIGFKRIDVNHAQGTILLYDPTGVVLLTTVVVDIYTPLTAEEYYAVTFKVTAEAELDDLAFYVAYNIDVYNPYPNWAYYENSLDLVYQYYGPNSYGNDIPERHKGYAGFASVTPASAYHDAVVHYHYVQYVANYLHDYDLNYRNRDIAYGDSSGDCGVGLQWTMGRISMGETATIPVVFAASGKTLDAFKASVMKAKMFAYESLSQLPTVTLDKSEGPGSLIVTSSGEGFMPYAPVNVYFSGVWVGSFIADRTGAFEGRFIVPTSVTGVYRVTAVDEYGLEASVDFEVVELTLGWILDKLDELNATIAGLLRDMNGTLCILISTTGGDILAKLSDVNATITDLIVGAKGEILAEITTVVGTLTAKLDEINATIVGLVRDINGTLCAKIDTAVGTITAGLDQLNATLVGLITTSKGDVMAQIETKAGLVLAKLDAINATIVGWVVGAAIETMAEINTAVGTITAKLVDLNATISSLVVDSSGEVLAIIDSKAGQVLAKLGTINATLTELTVDSKGEVVARIDTAVGTITTKLSEIDARVVELVTDAEGEILARVDSKVGTVLAKLDVINATLVAVKGSVATVSTDIGTIKTDIAGIHGEIISVKDDMVTIKTDIGEVQASLDDINAEITVASGDIATILTDIGTIQGTIESIQGDVVTIRTDIGTLTTTVDSIKYDTGLQRTNIALSLIAAISAIAAAVLILRKVFK